MPGSEDKPPPSAAALTWMERAVWILIFLGLLAFTLGLFLVRGQSELLGYFLIGKGGIAVAAGVVLIWFRSRWP